MYHNNNLPPIDKPDWEKIVNEVLPLDDVPGKSLFTYNSSSGLFPSAALRLSKVNAADHNSDEEQLRTAFESVNNYLYAKINNQEIDPENISNPFNKDLASVPEGEDALLDMILHRTEPNKLIVAESMLKTMDEYTQDAHEYRNNFESWKPIIQDEIDYIKNQIQVIDNSED